MIVKVLEVSAFLFVFCMILLAALVFADKHK